MAEEKKEALEEEAGASAGEVGEASAVEKVMMELAAEMGSLEEAKRWLALRRLAAAVAADPRDSLRLQRARSLFASKHGWRFLSGLDDSSVEEWFTPLQSFDSPQEETGGEGLPQEKAAVEKPSEIPRAVSMETHSGSTPGEEDWDAAMALDMERWMQDEHYFFGGDRIKYEKAVDEILENAMNEEMQVELEGGDDTWDKIRFMSSLELYGIPEVQCATGGGGSKPEGKKGASGGGGSKPEGKKGASGGGGSKPEGEKGASGGGGSKPAGEKGASGGGGSKPAGEKGASGGGGSKPAGEKGASGGGGRKPAGEQGAFGGGGRKPAGEQGASGGGGSKPAGEKGASGVKAAKSRKQVKLLDEVSIAIINAIEDKEDKKIVSKGAGKGSGAVAYRPSSLDLDRPRKWIPVRDSTPGPSVSERNIILASPRMASLLGSEGFEGAPAEWARSRRSGSPGHRDSPIVPSAPPRSPRWELVGNEHVLDPVPEPFGAESGEDTGAGTGEDAGAGTGEDAGAGTGENAGAGTGEDAGAGTGEDAGADAAADAGAGTGEDAGAGTGEDAGAGTGGDAGAGTGGDAGAGTGEDAGAGTGEDAGESTEEAFQQLSSMASMILEIIAEDVGGDVTVYHFDI